MVDNSQISKQEKLIDALVRSFEHEGRPVQLFETHISWIVVVGEEAYKFKKAVRFDFLDFSTLVARLFYCREELRLNRRTAPELYLDLVAVTGSSVHPVLGGQGTPIEYAVKMQTFSQDAIWRDRIAKGLLSNGEIDSLAEKLAQFHQFAAIVSPEAPWSEPDALAKIAQENLDLIAQLVKTSGEKGGVQQLSTWQSAQHMALRDVFKRRKADRFVRECHGDLHSGNILTLAEQAVLFDCIEFNERFRWIDVMSDLAFIYMDLQFQGLHALAFRLLNAYLEITGDYEGMTVLNYYQVQRALVRCKVDLLRSRQQDEASAGMSIVQARQAEKYLRFSLEKMASASPALLITHGFSGCGKSTVARCLVERIGAVQIRSDVERKRLHGLNAKVIASAPVGVGLYEPSVTAITYERLHHLAQVLLASGMSVIVDAAFLKKEQRRLFFDLASVLHVPFIIIDIHADTSTLRNRIAARAQLGRDPSDADLDVLQQQLAHHDVLDVEEARHVVSIDSDESDAALKEEMLRTACKSIMTVLCNGKMKL